MGAEALRRPTLIGFVSPLAPLSVGPAPIRCANAAPVPSAPLQRYGGSMLETTVGQADSTVRR